MANPGVFHRVFHPRNGRKNRIDWNQPDRLVSAFVLLARGETAADAHFEFGIELMFLIECADDLFRVENVIALHDLNFSGGDFALLVYV